MAASKTAARVALSTDLAISQSAWVLVHLVPIRFADPPTERSPYSLVALSKAQRVEEASIRVSDPFGRNRFVGLDVSQKMTAICIIDNAGRRLWRGQCSSVPEQICDVVLRHAGANVRIGIETGAMTPWLVHELRNLGLEVVCLDARHARAALEMQINKTDQNDAEGLAQIVRTGWYRSVHVKSFESHRARAFLGARAQLVGMRTRLSNHIVGVLKTFGLLPGAMRGLPFDRKVEVLLQDRLHDGDFQEPGQPALRGDR